MKPLISKIVKVLKREFTFDCTVTSKMNQVILLVKNIDFEQHLGRLLQQAQQIIDRHYPEREENVSIIIRTIDASKENVFKIWSRLDPAPALNR